MSVDDREISALALAYEGRSAREVLEVAGGRFATRLGFATGFGVEGCVIIDLLARHRVPVHVFTLDTGLLFPETYDLWNRLEEKYGIAIHAVRPAQTVEEQAAAHGEALWERDPDACCALRKVGPLRAELSKLDAWITAIRRDQTLDRATAGVFERDAKFGLVKVNPLCTWTSQDVWTYVRENQVPTNPLHDQGYPSIGCRPCTSAVRPGEDPRAGRWRGRAKTECGLHGKAAVHLPVAGAEPTEPEASNPAGSSRSKNPPSPETKPPHVDPR